MRKHDPASGSGSCDVLIIGGGPAGSTAAALLAERGKDVVMLEKDAHPRFHIGESLLPRNLAILERLGVLDEIVAIGVLKPGAEFVCDATGERIAFPFTLSLNRSYTHAYQVRRAEFDTALFANARRKGVRALERLRVTDVTFAEGERASVTAEGVSGSCHHFAPRFVLDASGRDTFLASRFRTRQADKRNNTAAVFAHYRDAAARSGDTAGYISIHLVDNGWIWMIPLTGGVMSVGFVGNQEAFKNHRGRPADLLDERIRLSRTVRARMREAERISAVQSTGNYSYRATTLHGHGWMMIGDAFAFIDPLFSTGVLLAMTAGEWSADAADTWLENPRAGQAKARRMERELRAMMDGISWFVYRIHDPILRAMLMSPRNTFGMRDSVITMLAGDLAVGWRARLPILALKTTFYGLSLAHRLGFAGTVVPRIAGAAAQ